MLDCRYVRLLVRRTTGTSDYKIYCRTTGPSKKIKVNGQELEAVTSFKYLGSVITDENKGKWRKLAAKSSVVPNDPRG